MKIYGIATVLSSLALVVGCNRPADQNSQHFDQNGSPPAVVAPAGTDQTGAGGLNQPPPAADSAVPSTSDGARPTTGIGDTPTVQSHHGNPERPSPPPDLPITPRRTPNLTDRPGARTTSAIREVTVPAGTALPLELTTPVSSDTAQVETPVRARLRTPVLVDGYTAIPAGTVFSGSVTDVEESGRVSGRAALTFRFTEAMVNGVRERVTTNPMTFHAEATKGEDATKIGAGAGIGAAIGAIVGGGSGAAKGAAIGGAAGTGAVLATKGKDVRLAEGADLTATLTQPVTVRAR